MHAAKVALVRLDRLFYQPKQSSQGGYLPKLHGIAALYVLSPLQQGLLFHNLHSEEKGQYVDQFILELHGDLHFAALQQTWQHMLDTHSILRTSFHWESLDKPIQAVRTHASLTIDRRNCREHEQKRILDDFLEEDRKRGFDLGTPPLMRVTLFCFQERRFILVWSVHHLILDGWSCGLVRDHLFAEYEAALAGRHAEFISEPPFEEYISWITRQDFGAAEEFWKRELNGFYEPVNFAGLLRAADPEHEGRPFNREFLLSEELSRSLESLAAREHVTLSVVFQAAWALVLSRYSGQNDIVFGLTVSGRSQPIVGIERMLGNLINTLPFRVSLSANDRVSGLLNKVHATNARIQRFEFTPLAEIQRWQNLNRGRSLFDSIMVFENATAASSASRNSLKFVKEHHRFRTNYPVTLQISPGRAIRLCFACEDSRIDATAVTRLAGHISAILAGFVSGSQTAIGDISILSLEERHLLVREWNDTEREYPKTSIAQVFEDQVAKSGSGVALIHGNQSVTYSELNARANRLARRIQLAGINSGMQVALYASRSVDMVAATLAIFKIGAAVVPIDPAYPGERTGYILADSGAKVVVTDSELAPALSGLAVKRLLLDATEDLNFSDKDFAGDVSPEHPAYLVYTSGSTGRPKGVAVPHRAVLRLVCNVDYVRLDGKQISLAHSPISFDASFFELWSTLLHGGRCVLYSGRGLSPAELRHLIANQGVDLLWLTASLFHLILDEDPDALQGIQQLLAGGESLSPRHVALAAQRLPATCLINGYGPTESATFGSCFWMRGWSSDLRPVPLGRPITNTTIYVLDDWLNLSPIGGIGQIYIGGDGLAHGYADSPELTAERFVPDPYTKVPGRRLYQTGDRARILPRGELEFLGRADDQVKIRGFRVEPGEIEAVLRSHAGIRDCAVITITGTDQTRSLVACLVPEAECFVDIANIKAQLSKVLPDYMVPSDFVALPSLPMSAHGKVDRHALLRQIIDLRDLGRLTSTSQPMLAEAREARQKTPTEQILAGIWGAVLDLDHANAEDDFFALGGHSLLAIRVLSRIREAFALDLHLNTLFLYPTLDELAREIEQRCGLNPSIPIPPLQKFQQEDDPPASFAQHRLWVIDQLEPGSSAYNIPLAVLLKGGGATLPELLERSLAMVVQRHEILRTVLPAVNGKPVQRVLAWPEFRIPLVDLTAAPEAQKEAMWRRLADEEATRPFQLTTGPLLRAMLVRLEPEKHVFLLTLHHIVADGWSLEVLLDELTEIYTSLLTGIPSKLPSLVVQYGDYARWQREWLKGQLLEELLDFWREQLVDAPSALRLPIDRPRQPMQLFRSSRHEVLFGPELSEALAKLPLNERATPFIVMLAGIFALLFRYTGEEDILIGTPSANRNRVELEPLIGFFSNILIVRGRSDHRTTFRRLVAAVRETVLKVHAYQDLPFEKLVEEFQPARQPGVTPYFQTVFSMYHARPATVTPGITMESWTPQALQAKFDLTIYALYQGGDLSVSIEYNRELFDSSSVLRMLLNYRNLMVAAAADPGSAVSALSLLSLAELHQVKSEWNDTLREYSPAGLIHQLFEKQAESTPNAIAVIYGDEQWTYRELNRMANRIARGLRAFGVGPECTVPVLLKRSARMVAALLGILKSGGAYVPLDPEYPSDRLAFMMNDANAVVVVTELLLQDRLGTTSGRTVLVEDLLASEQDNNLGSLNCPNNLAYVIYTSGSTGRPKGIMIEHRSAVVLLHWVRETFSLEELSGMLAGTSICFDVSIFEVFGPLSWGGSVRIIENALAIPSFRDDPAVRMVGSVPSAVAALLAADGIPQWATTLNLAGEAVPSGMAEQIFKKSNVCRITNLYGPSEDTTFSSIAFLTASSPQPPPIGGPIANTRFFVLDRELQFVPLGAVGEIYIAGEGLTRGYVGRPDLTAERYVPDPHSGQPGARMYRTGDQARYLSNGELAYLGRLDHQVKIRGFRVELGEIEAVLCEHPGVKQAVAAISEGDRVVAYIVPDLDASPEVSGIRAMANWRLPEYMSPSSYVVLDQLPLLPNGKLNRAALPRAIGSHSGDSPDFVAPRSELEQVIAATLRELLDAEEVGVNDHFFSDLGAHSLLLIQLAERLGRHLNARLSPVELFQFPTVATLAAHLDAKGEAGSFAEAVQSFTSKREEAMHHRREFRKAAMARSMRGDS